MCPNAENADDFRPLNLIRFPCLFFSFPISIKRLRISAISLIPNIATPVMYILKIISAAPERLPVIKSGPWAELVAVTIISESVLPKYARPPFSFSLMLKRGSRKDEGKGN